MKLKTFPEILPIKTPSNKSNSGVKEISNFRIYLRIKTEEVAHYNVRDYHLLICHNYKLCLCRFNWTSRLEKGCLSPRLSKYVNNIIQLSHRFELEIASINRTHTSRSCERVSLYRRSAVTAAFRLCLQKSKSNNFYFPFTQCTEMTVERKKNYHTPYGVDDMRFNAFNFSLNPIHCKFSIFY